jgi:hypothetical protein
MEAVLYSPDASPPTEGKCTVFSAALQAARELVERARISASTATATACTTSTV